jgi:hypothetical protein
VLILLDWGGVAWRVIDVPGLIVLALSLRCVFELVVRGLSLWGVFADALALYLFIVS